MYNKVRNIIITFVGRACAICVGLSLLFFLVAKIITPVDPLNDGELAIVFTQYLFFVLFSFVLSGASYLFQLPFPKVLNLAIHYVACLITFFVAIIATGKLVVITPSVILVFIVIFTMLYALFFGIYLLFRFLLFPENRKKKAEKKQKAVQEYKNRF